MCIAHNPRTSQSKPPPCPWPAGPPRGQSPQSRLAYAAPRQLGHLPGAGGAASEMAHSCRCSASSGCGLRAWRLPRGTEARFREQRVPREPAGTYVTLLSFPSEAAWHHFRSGRPDASREGTPTPAPYGEKRQGLSLRGARAAGEVAVATLGRCKLPRVRAAPARSGLETRTGSLGASWQCPVAEMLGRP